MSRVVIQGDASGTGDFTIAAPNSNTDRTLTLPDVAGTVLTSGSNADFPAGSVLQVVLCKTRETIDVSEQSLQDLRSILLFGCICHDRDRLAKALLAQHVDKRSWVERPCLTRDKATPEVF